MNLRNKGGVSPVVATVLLLLLTIGSVSIIAGVIIPFVRDSLTKSTSCIAYRDYFKFSTTFSYNCYKSESGNTLHAVTIRADASSELKENVDGFELVFLKTGSSKKIRVVNGSDVNYNANGVRMSNSAETKFMVPLPGETMTYVFRDSNEFSGVEIYPIVDSNKICERTDEIALSTCKGSVAIPI